MCKAWQEAQEEVARETAILTAIELWRDDKIPEKEIKRRIMTKYKLTEEEAEEYMMKENTVLV